MMPLDQIIDWLAKEKTLGSVNPERAVLATATEKAIPHSRIVAIREISPEGILFFTQRGTRKVAELVANPHASMTIWLAQQQREIVMDGKIKVLSEEENEHYWETMPHERQLRFSAYAPTSGQPIQSLDEINQSFLELSQQWHERKIPMSPFYCGFRLLPETCCFYTLGAEAFSEVILYQSDDNQWTTQYLSP